MNFVPPPKAKPRDEYFVETEEIRDRERAWKVTVFRGIETSPETWERVGEYERPFVGMYRTFEPFRQSDRHYALISRHHTTTGVMDLATGEVIAEEPIDEAGFCPVEFYVPDWYDVHDGSVMPGSQYWDDEKMAWPRGDFGFVAGCVWADDNAMKVQYLDLSRVSEGVITREERFGYFPLANVRGAPLQSLVRVYKGIVVVSTDAVFNLNTGIMQGDPLEDANRRDE